MRACDHRYSREAASADLQQRSLGEELSATDSSRRNSSQTVPEIASLLNGVETIDKLEFSCFGKDEFCSAVKSLPGNRNTLLVCGMEAHICVLQTVLNGLARGYLVHVASDAVGSRTEWNWRVGLDRMRTAGAVISSTEMMVYELLGKSGTPAFKELLQYIR
jgi:nicotinamidase-related amidase